MRELCPICRSKINKDNTHVKEDQYVYCSCGYPLFNRLLMPGEHWCQQMEIDNEYRFSSQSKETY